MSLLRVTASVLNVRRGPGSAFGILTRVPIDTILERRGESADGQWLRARVQLSDGVAEGWVSARYVADVATEPPAIEEPPWFAVARAEIGVSEYEGPDDNPRIVEYHQSTSLRAADDEVAWCSAFMNWCMKQAGLTGTGSAAARSWLNWGRPLDAPARGCIVVFRRGSNPVQGHVAIFVRQSGAFLDVLGGNQSNQVKIAPYPAVNVLSYRWPANVPFGA
jgi:uncharacterized protein (TIGR02594 family)